MPDAGLTLFLELPPDVHTVDRDAGQDVGLLLIAYWFPQRGVVPLPVRRPCRFQEYCSELPSR